MLTLPNVKNRACTVGRVILFFVFFFFLTKLNELTEGLQFETFVLSFEVTKFLFFLRMRLSPT